MTPFLSNFYASLRERVLSETPLPDFKEKHLFVARLRILLFLATWVMFFLFFPEIWAIKPVLPFAFNLGFLVTAVCYANILRENRVFGMVVVELFADVLTQTTILYMLGLDSPAIFLFYGLYVAAVGTLFGYAAGTAAAGACFACYALLFIAVKTGCIPPFRYPADRVGLVNEAGIKPFIYALLLPFALGFVVYGLRITDLFAQRRARALERRHIQLTALNNIGATIRKVLNLREVIEQVLKGVTKGLRFEVCLLALVDESRERLRFYVSGDNYYARKMQELLGANFSELRLPLYSKTNAIVGAIERRRVVIRNNFIELTHDLRPALNPHKCALMQSRMGFKKFVMTPLVAERKGMGAIVGVSTNPYIEDTVIDTLDHFANQAALAVESAQLFEALEERNRELIRANQVKSEFLAIMSHELRTPLIAVIGYSEILLDRLVGDLNADQTNAVREVLRNAKNLLELINSILDLAKIESGKMDLSLEGFELQELVDEVRKTLAPLLSRKNHSFEVRLPEGGLPLMIADTGKVRQILINLVGNAVKFTDDGGRIAVDIACAERAEAFITTEFPQETPYPAIMERKAFLIKVSDNGVGIRPENLRRIFDVFSQADVSYSRSHEGTGLGLALTKQLVLLHSGLIAVESEYGKGSTFKILIPQGLPAELPKAETAPEPLDAAIAVS